MNIPIDFCGADYQFVAKVAVRKLILTAGLSEVTFEVLKLFSAAEAFVITQNFSKHG